MADWTPLVLVNVAAIVAFVGVAGRAAVLHLHRAPTAEVAAGIGVVLAVLALAWAAPWGPEEVNSHARLANPLLGKVTWIYGQGVPAWGTLVHTLVPGAPDDLALFHAAPFVTGLGALAVVHAVRALGAPLGAALGAGLAAGLAGPALRWAHTDAPHAPETLLLWGGLVLVARHARRPSWPDALAGAGAIGVAAQMRPEAVFLTLPALAYVATLPTRPSLRHPATWVGVGLVVALSALHLLGALSALAEPGVVRPHLFLGNDAPPPIRVHGPRHLAFLDPTHVGWVFPFLGLLGAAAGPVRPRVRVVLALSALGLALLVGGPPWYSPIDGERLIMLRFQLRALPWFGALVGLGAAAVARLLGGRWGGAFGGVVLVAALSHPLPDVLTPRAHTLEYRFFREQLALLPEPCTVSTLFFPYDAGFSPDTFADLARAGGRRVEVVPLDQAVRPGCHVYYRPANCSMAPRVTDVDVPPAHEACAAWEARHRLEPLAATHLPTLTLGGEAYRTDPVEVGFYRVAGASEGAVAP